VRSLRRFLVSVFISVSSCLPSDCFVHESL
jgi:hypothetical protein